MDHQSGYLKTCRNLQDSLELSLLSGGPHMAEGLYQVVISLLTLLEALVSEVLHAAQACKHTITVTATGYVIVIHHSSKSLHFKGSFRHINKTAPFKAYTPPPPATARTP